VWRWAQGISTKGSGNGKNDSLPKRGHGKTATSSQHAEREWISYLGEDVHEVVPLLTPELGGSVNIKGKVFKTAIPARATDDAAADDLCLLVRVFDPHQFSWPRHNSLWSTSYSWLGRDKSKWCVQLKINDDARKAHGFAECKSCTVEVRWRNDQSKTSMLGQIRWSPGTVYQCMRKRRWERQANNKKNNLKLQWDKDIKMFEG
jgi:hypothetical protein